MLGQQVALDTLVSTAWDVVVIGGGITGAGIFLESARRGLKVLLLEQQDFSWGTSSRSSKMVHGGLRYIAQGDISLTHHSLQERERLLTELPQLVVRMSYYFPIRKGQFPGRLPMQLVMKAYDALARVNDHNWLNPAALQQQFPDLNPQQLKGALRYTDALTDDSRLVIRVLQEGCLEGGIARNYSKIIGISGRIHQQDGQHVLRVQDQRSQQSIEVRCKHLFNATGLWADQLSGTSPRIRPQRGSHLFISKTRLPIQSCLTLLHPDDQRYVFVYPWKGETCVGTTDLDHRFELDEEAFCTTQEVDYLLKLLNTEFPDLHIGKSDILSTMAGVRPIIAGHASNPSASKPSKERRSHLVWQADGVISVSGGKLTTFRQIALDALHTAGLIDDSAYKTALKNKVLRCFNHLVSTPSTLDDPLADIASGSALQQQVEWILVHEMVQHLDDLMLRRLRVGNMLADAGLSLLPQIKPLCQRLLNWNDAHWEAEVLRYQAICRRYYQPQNVQDQVADSEALIAGISL